ncbi:MAG: outer membrane beta-barrel protein [Saprospiraceae bacterium]|nr:outer membrane beta-barrel protein [Saprospiraceae bacterium]
MTRDFCATIIEIVDEKGTFLIPRNMDKAINNGLTISYPQQVTNWWNLLSFVNYNHSIYKGNLAGTIIDLKANILNLRVQNNIKLPGNISMDLTYSYNSPWIWRGTIYVQDYHGVNIGFRKSFFDNRLLGV